MGRPVFPGSATKSYATKNFEFLQQKCSRELFLDFDSIDLDRRFFDFSVFQGNTLYITVISLLQYCSRGNTENVICTETKEIKSRSELDCVKNRCSCHKIHILTNTDRFCPEIFPDFPRTLPSMELHIWPQRPLVVSQVK